MRYRISRLPQFKKEDQNIMNNMRLSVTGWRKAE